MASSSVRKVHCNHCSRTTTHKVLHTEFVYTPSGEDLSDLEDAELTEDPDPEDWSESYQVLQCAGCETVTVRHESRFWNESTKETSSTVSFYPARVFRRVPPWLYRLPEDLQNLVREIYVALATNSRRLAMMGLRTIIDMVALDKVGDKGTFKAKLDTLVERGHISQAGREHLEAALDAGSAAAHRGHSPSEDDIENSVEIIENLLHATYVLRHAAEGLRRNTPQRPRKTR